MPTSTDLKESLKRSQPSLDKGPGNGWPCTILPSVLETSARNKGTELAKLFSTYSPPPAPVSRRQLSWKGLWVDLCLPTPWPLKWGTPAHTACRRNSFQPGGSPPQWNLWAELDTPAPGQCWGDGGMRSHLLSNTQVRQTRMLQRIYELNWCWNQDFWPYQVHHLLK